MNDIEDMTFDIEQAQAILDLCDIPKVNRQGRPLSLRIRIGLLAEQAAYTLTPDRVDKQMKKNRSDDKNT